MADINPTNPISNATAATNPVVDNTTAATSLPPVIEGELVLPDIHLDSNTVNHDIQLPDLNLQSTSPLQEVAAIATVDTNAVSPVEISPIAATPTEAIPTSTEVASEATSTVNETTNMADTATNIATSLPKQDDDPFEGLNLVFDTAADKPTPISWAATTVATPAGQVIIEQAAPQKEFVDPFLNTKVEEKPAETSSALPVTTETTDISNNNNENAVTTEPMIAGAITNLDSLLTTIEPTKIEKPNLLSNLKSLTGKKKKFLIAASGIVGLLFVVSSSYLVFTTMYSQDTGDLAKNLQWDISWPQDTTPAVETTPEPEVQPEQKDNVYNPTAEETLPVVDQTDTSANKFDEGDELPASNSTTSTLTSTTDTSSEDVANENSETTTIAPEVTEALATIDAYVDKCKQLLALAKEKNDIPSIKSIAGILKASKEIKKKIDEKTYVTYSTDIEKPLTEIWFNLDQVAATLIEK